MHRNIANNISEYFLYSGCDTISVLVEIKYAEPDRPMLRAIGHSCCIRSVINAFLAVVERVSCGIFLIVHNDKGEAAGTHPKMKQGYSRSPPPACWANPFPSGLFLQSVLFSFGPIPAEMILHDPMT